MKTIEAFFYKFYSDSNPRRMIFGINPGRFGAGTTGINFTAPKQLQEFCGIEPFFQIPNRIVSRIHLRGNSRLWRS